MKSKFLGLMAPLLIAFGWCGAVQAVPVELEYSGVVNDSTTPGVSVGDTITFDVFADNGGASLNSQSWSWTNLTSATIEAGSYSATTSGPVSGGFGGFSTDASGQLITLYFGTIQNGTDTNGNPTFAYYMDSSNDIWYASNNDFTSYTSFGALSPPNIDNTSISLVSSTPLPAALPLFAGGLGMIGLIAGRKKRKAAATPAA